MRLSVSLPLGEHLPRYNLSWLSGPVAHKLHVAVLQSSSTSDLAATPPINLLNHRRLTLRPTMTSGTDSPIPRLPLDPKEQPILDKLQSIRTELELLKRDRSTYVKSQDVLKLYDQVIEQVMVLNEIRVTKRLEQNKGMSRSRLPNGDFVTDTIDSRLYA
jgi:hypothetical protein